VIVDDDPNSGDCSGLGAASTIQEGVNQASNGDVILVCNGTYTEAVDVNKSVTLGARADVTVDGSGIDDHGFNVTATDVAIDGFAVENFSTTGQDRAGVYVDGVSTVQVSNNSITNISDNGVVVENGGSNIGIQDNGIDTVATGVRLAASGGGTTEQVFVVNNTVSNAATAVTTEASGDTSTLRDSFVVGTSASAVTDGAVVSAGIGDATSDVATVDNVTYVGNQFSGLAGAGILVSTAGGATLNDLNVTRNDLTGTSTALDVAANESSTVSTLSVTETLGDNAGNGIDITVNDSATLSGAEVDRNFFNESQAGGFRIVAGQAGGTGSPSVSNLAVNGTRVNGTVNGPAIELVANADATLDAVSVTNVSAANSQTGVRVAGTGTATITDLAIDRANLTGNSGASVSLTADDAATISTATLRRTLAENSGAGAVLRAGLAGSSDTATIENVALDTVGLNSTAGTGLRVDANGDTTVQNLSVDTADVTENAGPAVDVTADSTATVTQLSISRVLPANSSDGVRIATGNSNGGTATVSDVVFDTTGLNGTDGTGLALTAEADTRISDVQFDTVDATDNTGPAIRIDSNDTATVRDVLVQRVLPEGSADGVLIGTGQAGGTDTSTVQNVTFDTTGLNATSGTGLGIDANADTTVDDITLSTVEGGANTVGVDVSAAGTSTVSDLSFVEYRAEANSGQGVVIQAGQNGTSDTATVENVSFDAVAINDTAGTGLDLLAAGDGTVRNVSANTVAMDGNDRGIRLRQADSGQVRLRVERTLIQNGGQGVLVDGAGSATPRLTVRESLLRNNANEGLVLTSATDPADTEVRFNFITGNGEGIINRNASTTANVSARLNYWGSDSGPGTQSGASTFPIEDPVTGGFANGTGDTVSERGTSGVSNVVFDPWLGKQVCQDPQLFNVSTALFDFPTVSAPGSSDEVSTAQVAPVCAWERSILPLRTADGDAATSVELPQTFLELSTGEQANFNRDQLSIYQQGESFDVRYRDVTGANTERFAGDDAQLVIIRGSSTTTLQNATFDLNRTTSEARLGLNGTDVQVFDDAEGVGTVDSTGAVTATFTPSTADQYTFLLFRRTYGDGLAVQNGNLTFSGGVDLVGVETAAVQVTNSSAQPVRSNATYFQGEDVNVSVDSRLGGSGTTRHFVLLYNESTVDAQTAVVGLEEAASEYVLGNATLANVTLETSISGVSGSVLSEESATVQFNVSSSLLGLSGPFSASISEGRTSDTVSTRTLLNDSGIQVTVTQPSTRLNGSVAVAANSSSSRVVTVPTQTDFPTGTYRFIHIAQRSDSLRSFSSSTGSVNIETPPTPTPTPGPGTPTPTPAPGAPGGGGGGGVPDSGDGGDTFQVLNATLEDDRIAPGETTNVTVEVRNNLAVRTLIGEEISVTARGEEVASTRVTLESQETETVRIPFTLTQEGRFTIRANGESAGVLTVLPENVLERAESRSFDRDSTRPGVQVRFPSTAVTEITFPEPADGTARVDQLRQIPSDVSQPPGTMVIALNITVPEKLRTQSATIRFEVDRSQLDQAGVTADSVTLWRYNDGEWQQLEMRRLGESGGTLTYEADTPGFSVFAVTGQQESPTPTPTPTPTTATPTPTDTPTDTASPTGPTETSPPGDGGDDTGLILGVLIVVLLIAAAGAAYYLSQQEE